MKTKRKHNLVKVLVSLVLVITMLFSVLNIFNVVAKESEVLLTNVTITNISDGSEASVTDFENTKIVTNIVFHKLNDSVSYRLTIKNNGDNEKTITDITDDNTNQNIVFEYDKHIGETIAPEEEINIDVEAIYKNETEDNEVFDKEIKFIFTFEEDEEVPVPMTGDNLYLYIVLLIISIIGLVITHTTNKRIKKVMVLLLVVTPIITKALTVEYTLLFTNSIKVQDRQTVKYVVDGNEEEKVIPYNTKAEKPTDPEKVGYDFIGWYDENDEPFDFNTNVKEDVTLNAKFEAQTVNYKVIHKQQNLDNDEYTEKDVETLEGKYDAPITPSVKTYNGFTSPAPQMIKLGSNTEITYLYTRNSYKVTYKYEGKVPAGASSLPIEKTYKFETVITKEADASAPGYSFNGWSVTDSTFTIPANDLVITGSFTALGDTAYTVEHYFETLTDNEYVINDLLTDHLTGETDTDVTGTSKTVTGFAFDTNNANNVKTGTINGNGTLVLKLYYKRNRFNVTYSYTGINPEGATALPEAHEYKYEQEVTVAPSASAPGYEFSGWSRTGTFNMPNEAVTITGSFTAKTDTAYKIEHYFETLTDNEYAINDLLTDNLTGETGTTKTASSKTVTGFTYDVNNANNVKEGTIKGDGSLTLKLYYKRNKYNVTYSYTNTPNGASTLPAGKQYKYEEQVPIAPVATAPGYDFSGWSRSTAFSMPAEDVAITGSFTARNDTPYKIEYYLETLTDGEFVLNTDITDNLTGTTDTEANATGKAVTGFTFDTSNANNVKIGNIDGNGNLVLKLYYTRNEYSLTYQYTNNPAPEDATALPVQRDYKYEQEVMVAPSASAQGYEFSGWSRTGTFNMPASDTVITGTFTPKNNTPYKVEHYFETLTDNQFVINNELTDNLTGTTDTTSPVATSKTITGFTYDDANSNNVKSGIIKGDGSLVLKLYYTRNRHNVSYRYTNSPVPTDATILPQTKEYKYEELVSVITDATATGYSFGGWSVAGPFSMPDEAVEITGTFIPNTYQIIFDKNDNDATGTMDNQEMTYDQQVTLTANAYTKVGYHFSKWTTNSDGNGTEYIDEASVKNLVTTGTITLYANYAPNTNTPYKVEHYMENANGTYEVSGTKYELTEGNIDNLTGTTNETVTITPKTVTSHEFVQNISDALSQVVAADGSLVVKLYYNLKTYTVTLNANTGNFYASDDSFESTKTITKKHGEMLTLSELPDKPNVDKKHSSLAGWYTEATSGSKVEAAVEITDNETYYAQWNDVPIMCVKATELHEEECHQTTNGCHKNGYAYGDAIIYGNTAASATPQIGDAYDCDINNDQVYDPATERFYYLKTENDKAALIFFSIYDGTGINTKASIPYDEAINSLPTDVHSKWYNLDNPARFLTHTEASSASICSSNFKHCDYVLENTVYHYDVSGIQNDEDKPFRSGLWLIDGSDIWRIQTNSLQYDRQSDTRVNAIKPVIEVPISRMDTTANDKFTVTFNAESGTIPSAGSIQVITVGRGGVVREFPTPTLSGSTFKGWYTSETFETSVSAPVKNITENKTYYAKWAPNSGYAAMIGEIEYPTLQSAINAATSTGSEPTTILLLKDVAEEITVDNSKNIKLNLQGNVLSNTGNDKHVITVNSGSSLEVSGGTVTSSANVSMLNVNGGTLKVSGGTYNATGSGEVLDNTGNVTISGSTAITLTSASATKPTITNNGTLTIHHGTIKSTGSNAIYNESGTFNIGANTALSYTDPTIQGATYGIVAKENYNFYDGIIKGGTAPVAKATGDTPTITTDDEHTTITNIESDSVYVTGTETDNQVLYQTLSLRYYTQVFILTFDAGSEGTPQTQTKVVDRLSGEAVGVLPSEPTREHYIFEGWYTEVDGGGTKVTSSTIPAVMQGVDPDSVESAYITYYANWVENTAPDHTVTYNANGGKFSNNSGTLVITVDDGGKITSFPEEPTNTNTLLTFDGWYSDSELTQEVVLPVTVTEDKEFFAKWHNESIALINDEYCNCTTLRQAFSQVTTTGNTRSEVKLLKDVEVTASTNNGVVSGGKNILLDLQGHQISNNLSIDVKDIEINDGKLEVTNGTITSKATAATLQLAEDGELIVTTDAVITHTGTKQAIYNDGGKVTITNNANISNTVNNRAAVHNKGTLLITGGTIISNNAFGVAVESGTLTIGVKDGNVDTTSPIIQGKTYGVTSAVGYNFYDGTIKGQTYPIGIATQNGYNTNSTNDTTKSKIADKETNTDYVMDNEGNYKILYLEPIVPQTHTVTFIPGEGASSVAPQTVNDGESLTEIPEPTKDHYDFAGWYTGEHGEGDRLTLETTFTADATYYANWVESLVNPYTITFVVGEGATPVNPQYAGEGETLQSIPTSTKEGFTLEGWYTGENGTGNKLTLETTFDNDTTYYANWVPVSTMICRPATELHKENCGGTDTGKGCRADGYQSNVEITYGNIVDDDELAVGDALDCDVDGTGYNHRFYYLRTNNDNAILIYNTNYEGTEGPGISASYSYDDSHDALPTTTQWSNLPASSNYSSGKAARFATREDLRVAVGAQNVGDLATAGVFKPINFIYENTSYANASGHRSTVWLEAEGSSHYRYHKDGRNVGDGGDKNAVRPVIEVPLSKIEMPEDNDVTLTFNTDSGSNVNPIDLTTGEKLSSIPVSTKEGYSLDGWYTEANGQGTRLDLETTFNDDATYYANWVANKEVVNHDTVPVAMRTYFNSISTWANGATDASHADYDTAMTDNLNNNDCVYFTGDNRDTEYRNNYCDQPNKYDTTVNETLKIYKYNSTNKVVGEEATYVSSYNGKIYNMIPNETYYWKSTEDASNYGFVKATGERRILSIDNIQMDGNTKASGTLHKMRNVRDLGGIPVTYTDSNNNTITGHIKYGKLFRGERIWKEGSSNIYLNKLGIYNELDLRGSGEVSSSLDVNLDNNITSSPSTNTFEIIHYGIDYNGFNGGYSANDQNTHYDYYDLARNALTRVMQEFVDAHEAGDDDFSLLFHCRIGADRTGTLAYLIEGVLGASEEERYRDYELTVFFGLRERTRFYLNKSDNYVKFQHLKQAIRDAGDGVHEDVIAWYLKGSSNPTADSELIDQFRSILVETN